MLEVHVSLAAITAIYILCLYREGAGGKGSRTMCRASPCSQTKWLTFSSSVSLSQSYPAPCQSFKLKAGLRKSTFQHRAVMHTQMLERGFAAGCWWRNPLGPGELFCEQPMWANMNLSKLVHSSCLLRGWRWIPTPLCHELTSTKRRLLSLGKYCFMLGYNNYTVKMPFNAPLISSKSYTLHLSTGIFLLVSTSQKT